MSESRDLILRFITSKTISSVLKRRSKETAAIQALQNILHELGFDEQLNWQKYGADGDYGGSTTKAVKEFIKKNSLSGNGESVSEPTGTKLLSRHGLINDLLFLHNAVKSGLAEQLFYRTSPNTDAVAGLQRLLHSLGFGEELKWEKYGADGDYGSGTEKALRAYLTQEELPGDGTRLSREAAKRILNRFKGYYGSGLSERLEIIEQLQPREVIEQLLHAGTIADVLRKKTGAVQAVKALQNILHEIGFGNQLKWKQYGADGDYGGATTHAVKAFADRNDLPGDGHRITEETGKTLLLRYDALDDLRHLNNAVIDKKLEQFFFYGSNHSTAVVVLQTLLNALGFSAELKWEKYGADGKYFGNTTKALKAFAKQQGIQSDGKKLTPELANSIIDKLQPYYGEQWAGDTTITQKHSGELSIRETVEGGRSRIYVGRDGKEVRLTKFRKGIYYSGKQKTRNFLTNNQSTLSAAGLNESMINIMTAVSENEGNLDAINTWDNAFLTFGMFQWTVGTENGAGELPALLQKIKNNDPSLFDTCFGQYGLDLTDTNPITGYFTLNGKKIKTPAEKELLRTTEWAFYFWLAGQQPEIQTIEVQHALSRISTFYKKGAYKVKGHLIAEIITSEYGVGLLLDNHVNRPAYIKPCLEKAMDKTGLSTPRNWSTSEERKLIDAYLKIRETHGRSPMTDAKKRAAVTGKYLENGIISDERGSFQFD